MKNINNKLWLLLVILLLATVAYSGLKILEYYLESYATAKLHGNLKAMYDTAQDDWDKDNDINQSGANMEPEDLFQPLLAINEDIVGWLRIEGTRIDHPVVQASDNSYYLDRNVKREKSKRGAIFMDYRNRGDGEDLNTVIYGHSFKDGSMFGELSNYKKKAYFQEHPHVELDLLDEKTRWQIFSVYIYSPAEGSFMLSFTDSKDYSRYLAESGKRSMYPTGVEVSTSDTILTLMTCSYEFNNARLVIQAKKIPPE